jgi:FMN phosphatase YigB (HAD superfamily)
MKIVLFDMMDTLIHEPYFTAIGRLLPPDLTPASYFGWRDRTAFAEFERGEISEQEHFRRFYLPGLPSELRQRYPRPERVKKELLRSLRYVDGIPGLLSELRARPEVRLGVASNYAIWYLEMLERLRDIREHMHYFFYSCEMGVRKPDPEYYTIIASGLARDFPELAAADIFFTDDRQTNIDAAAAMGWRVHRMDGNTAALRAAILAFLAGD